MSRASASPTERACFSSVVAKAAGDEKSRFLSSFRTNSVANCSPAVAADLARSSA